MKDLKCPVCGKNGIPDFHEEDVVCPCCGSDLSIYHKLSDLSGINRGKSVRNKSCKYLTYFAGILIFVSITGCIFLYIQRSQINDLSKNVQITREQNSLLKDSIIYLNERIAEQSIPHKPTQKRAHIYVVKKGDSFCRISRQLYGTEARYIEIVKLNNLNAKTILHEGDSLKVPKK